VEQVVLFRRQELRGLTDVRNLYVQGKSDERHTWPVCEGDFNLESVVAPHCVVFGRHFNGSGSCIKPCIGCLSLELVDPCTTIRSMSAKVIGDDVVDLV